MADYGCLHFKFPIICGVSEPTYDAGELKKMKKADKKTIVFEGKDIRVMKHRNYNAKLKHRYDMPKTAKLLPRPPEMKK